LSVSVYVSMFMYFFNSVCVDMGHVAA